MASKLHQLLAVVAERTKSSKALCAEAIKTFSEKHAIFRGQKRTVRAFDEARAQELNAEEVIVVSDTVGARLKYVFNALAKELDLIAQIDEANGRAKAIVELPGLNLPPLPAITLLALESRADEWIKIAQSLPTLELGIEWVPAEEIGKGVLRNALPERTNKTERITVPVVMYEATKEHPAQVDKVVTDRANAAIELMKFSGMISARQKADLLERLNTLKIAITTARCKANEVDVSSLAIGDILKEYICAGF